MIDLDKFPLHKAISYSLTALSFTAPGVLYLFIFNRPFLVSADPFKVLMVALAVSWPIYIASALEAMALMTSMEEKDGPGPEGSGQFRFLFITSLYVAWTFYPVIFAAYIGKWSSNTFVIVLAGMLLLTVVATGIKLLKHSKKNTKKDGSAKPA